MLNGRERNAVLRDECDAVSRDIESLARTLGPARVAEIIEALTGMVANACTVDGELYARHSSTNEHAISVLVRLGIAEWVNEKRGFARWKP